MTRQRKPAKPYKGRAPTAGKLSKYRSTPVKAGRAMPKPRKPRKSP